MNARNRKARRILVDDLVMCILRTEKDGIKVSVLYGIVSKACRFRMSTGTMSQIMKPRLTSGEITSSRTVENHAFWKLSYPLVGNGMKHELET